MSPRSLARPLVPLVVSTLLACAWPAAAQQPADKPLAKEPAATEQEVDQKIAETLSAVVRVKMRAVPDARSNATLGDTREGSGIVIEPGWVLVLPANAVDRGRSDHATGTLLHPLDAGPGQKQPEPDQTPAPTDERPPAPPQPSTPDPTTPGQSTPPSGPGASPQPSVSVYPQPDDTDHIDGDDAEDGGDSVVLGGSRNGVLAGAAIVSTHSCGGMPACSADWATFCPCSSMPIRKWTSSPRRRRYRAMQSAPIFSSACPRCGSPLA